MSAQQILAILGASDPEMERIEALLRSVGAQVRYARGPDWRRVDARGAYEEVQPEWPPAGCRLLVVVECALRVRISGVRHVRVDHHRPGDPGYGRPPKEYWEASSLGQVVTLLQAEGLLGDEIPEDWRYAAAADHCLGAAYQGRCPGVDPDRLFAWRLEGRAKWQKRPVADLLADGRAALEMIAAAPLVCIGGVEVRDLRGASVAELPDAQGRSGESVICGGLPGRDGRTKVNVMGSAAACAAFLDSLEDLGLVDGYGDPCRGIVGAYRE